MDSLSTLSHPWWPGLTTFQESRGAPAVQGKLGLIFQTRGELDKARKLWTKALDLFAKIGMPHMVEKVQGWLDGLPNAGEDRS